MKNLMVSLLAFLLGTGIDAACQNKGNCPPMPTPPKPTEHRQITDVPLQPPPSPDAKFAGTVSLMAVISDRGYVCGVHLIRGFDKTADAGAIQALRRRHFQPAQKDGNPVAVVIITDVTFWRDGNGNLVQSAPK